MKGKITATASMFLLLLLLLTFGAEADRCKAWSKNYKKSCNHHNCWAVCMTEGSTGGFCKFTKLGRRCMCTRECGGGGGGAPKLPPGGGGGGGGDGGDPPVLAGGNNVLPLLGRRGRGDHA